MLTVEGLTCRYGKVAAVRELSIEVKEGELVSLIGANGAGKTTLMRMLATLDTPDGGSIHLGGINVVAHPAKVRRAQKMRQRPGRVVVDVADKAEFA